MNTNNVVDQFRVPAKPNYIPQDNEAGTFKVAFAMKLPLVAKGPTGCGKTRFIEAMAYELDVPLITVSCHEDLTAADLVGRYLFKDDQTVWQDGPLTLAVRHGGICYLDEIVEARKDTTVIIHSLTDHRRILYIDKTGEVIRAHDNFMMVLSYNPGYQSIVKDLKHSTRQRFVSLVFNYPNEDVETKIIRTETGLDEPTGRKLAQVGAEIRKLKGFGLDEGVSTRLLVYVGQLIKGGLSPIDASRAALSQTLADEAEIIESIDNIVQLHFGDLMGATDAPDHD